MTLPVDSVVPHKICLLGLLTCPCAADTTKFPTAVSVDRAPRAEAHEAQTKPRASAFLAAEITAVTRRVGGRQGPGKHEGIPQKDPSAAGAACARTWFGSAGDGDCATQTARGSRILGSRERASDSPMGRMLAAAAKAHAAVEAETVATKAAADKEAMEAAAATEAAAEWADVDNAKKALALAEKQLATASAANKAVVRQTVDECKADLARAQAEAEESEANADREQREAEEAAALAVKEREEAEAAKKHAEEQAAKAAAAQAQAKAVGRAAGRLAGDKQTAEEAADAAEAAGGRGQAMRDRREERHEAAIAPAGGRNFQFVHQLLATACTSAATDTLPNTAKARDALVSELCKAVSTAACNTGQEFEGMEPDAIEACRLGDNGAALFQLLAAALRERSLRADENAVPNGEVAPTTATAGSDVASATTMLHEEVGQRAPIVVERAGCSSHEPLRVVVSTPEMSFPDNENVMEFITSVCRRYPDLLKMGFDFAGSGSSTTDADKPRWERLFGLKGADGKHEGGLMLAWTNTGLDSRGEEYEAVRDEVTKTDWYMVYTGLVIGRLKAAILESPTGTVVSSIEHHSQFPFNAKRVCPSSLLLLQGIVLPSF